MTDYRVLHLLPDLTVGGGQMMVLRLAVHLRKKGCGVMIAACRPGGTMSQQFKQAEIPVIDAGMTGIRNFRQALRRLENVAVENDISILHTHGTMVDKIAGHILSSRLHIPEVTTLHGMLPVFGPRRRSLRSLLRSFLELGSFKLDWWLARGKLVSVVAVSDAVLEAWRPVLRQSTSGSKVDERVIHWGVDAREFRQPDPEQIMRIREEITGSLSRGGPLILSVSRLHTSKNVDTLPEAMMTVIDRWPDAILGIVGDGPERQTLERKVGDLSLNSKIRFLGERRDVPSLLAAADITVFPSRVEGFGMVALESLAAGTPVVCFDLPSLKALRRDVDAIRIVAGTGPTEMGRTISAALSDQNLPAAGQQARDIVLTSWNLDKTASEYDSLYRAILSKNGKLPDKMLSASDSYCSGRNS